MTLASVSITRPWQDGQFVGRAISVSRRDSIKVSLPNVDPLFIPHDAWSGSVLLFNSARRAEVCARPHERARQPVVASVLNRTAVDSGLRYRQCMQLQNNAVIASQILSPALQVVRR